MDDWRKYTDYQRCACCGMELEGMIQEVIPGRKRVLVTCTAENCHDNVKWQTLSAHEHAALCYAVSNSKVKS